MYVGWAKKYPVSKKDTGLYANNGKKTGWVYLAPREGLEPPTG